MEIPGLFEKRVVLVTGGASGIGKEAAFGFGRAGAHVVVSDLSFARADDVASVIRNAGGKAIAAAADVTSAADVETLCRMITETFGGLDIAVNSAGIGGTPGPLMEMSESNFDQVVATNLKGVWLCMRYQLPMMLERGGGAIINIASALGLIALPNSAAYTAAKHGVVGLTKVAALEVASQGIRVNAVCPGVIDTPLNIAITTDPAALEQMEALHPIGRLGRAEEVAAAILWLASPQSSFVTGAAIPVDGGWTTG